MTGETSEEPKIRADELPPVEPPVRAEELAPPRATSVPQAPPSEEVHETIPAGTWRLGDRVRRQVRESRYNDQSELVPNDDGVVYGPSRAEIILAFIKAGAWSPVIAILVGIAVGIAQAILGTPLFPSSGGRFLPYVGTGVFLAALLSLAPTLGRKRRLMLVRARVFERERGPWVQVGLCIVYVAIVILSLK